MRRKLKVFFKKQYDVAGSDRFIPANVLLSYLRMRCAMKKLLPLLLTLSLLLTLCACGQGSASDSTPAQSGTTQSGPTQSGTTQPQPDSSQDTATPAALPQNGEDKPDGESEEPPPAENPEVQEQPGPSDTPPAEQTGTPPEPVETSYPTGQEGADVAKGLIGATVEELYAALGEPASAEYAAGCLTDGDEGTLYYEGFVVYTTRDDRGELVYDAFSNDELPYQ